MDEAFCELVLTAGERKAIDWVGDRYDHGDGLYDVLCGCDTWLLTSGEECDVWDSPNDILFNLTENQVLDIVVFQRVDHGQWTCFSASFAAKLNELCRLVKRAAWKAVR